MPSELCSGASALKKPYQVKARNAAMKTHRHKGERGAKAFPEDRNAPEYTAYPMAAIPTTSRTPG